MILARVGVGNAARAASIRYVHTATPVLISGGGPAGLVTALSLGRCVARREPARVEM